MQVNLFHTAFMTLALGLVAGKVRSEEGVDNLKCLGYRQIRAGHAEDVGVVVLASQNGERRIPANGSTDAVVFVTNHVDAIAGRADGYSVVTFAAADSLSHLMTKIGIVARLCAIATIVNYLGAAVLEEELHLLLEVESSVV